MLLLVLLPKLSKDVLNYKSKRDGIYELGLSRGDFTVHFCLLFLLYI